MFEFTSTTTPILYTNLVESLVPYSPLPLAASDFMAKPIKTYEKRRKGKKEKQGLEYFGIGTDYAVLSEGLFKSFLLIVSLIEVI